MLGLLGAAIVGSIALPAAAVAATAPLNSEYVALGDSFSAGPGILPQVQLDPCFRSGVDYAHLVAAAIHAATFRDVTCSGATTGNMTAPQNAVLPWDPPAPPQFNALTSSTTLVSVTIGANDAGLVGLAETCLNLLPQPLGTSCQAKETAGGVDRGAQAVDAAAQQVAATLDAIHQRSPRARVLVTSYGDYEPAGGCYPLQPIWGVDSDYLQGLINRLGQESAAAVSARPYARYVDFIGPGAGHTACNPGNNWVTGFVPVDGIVPLHPTAQGEQAFANIILGSLAY